MTFKVFEDGILTKYLYSHSPLQNLRPEESPKLRSKGKSSRVGTHQVRTGRGGEGGGRRRKRVALGNNFGAKRWDRKNESGGKDRRQVDGTDPLVSEIGSR